MLLHGGKGAQGSLRTRHVTVRHILAPSVSVTAHLEVGVRMSRGLGTQQRAILTQLASHPDGMTAPELAWEIKWAEPDREQYRYSDVAYTRRALYSLARRGLVMRAEVPGYPHPTLRPHAGWRITDWGLRLTGSESFRPVAGHPVLAALRLQAGAPERSPRPSVP